MAISRKPKVKREDDEGDEMLGVPMAQTFEPDEEEQKVDPRDEELERMRQQMEALQSRMQERDSELEYLRAPAWQSQVTQSEPVYEDPNKIALPDPALDPDGYAAAVERRVEVKNANRQKRDDWQKKRESEIDTRVASLWDDFNEAYPEIAINNERVEFLATKMADEARKQGKDVEKYMFVTRKTFMRDLADRYEKTFGPVDQENDEEDIDTDERYASRSPARRRTRTRDRDQEDSGRSAGIFSSNPSGSRRSRPTQEAPGNMIEELQEFQKKGGFF